MIGRKVQSSWHRLQGTVVKWEPLGAAMCDALVQPEDGSFPAWVASTDLRPADGLGPLPSRREAQERARAKAVTQLREIRAQHVRDFREPWPGMEHGKAIFGMAVDGALRELQL